MAGSPEPPQTSGFPGSYGAAAAGSSVPPDGTDQRLADARILALALADAQTVSEHLRALDSLEAVLAQVEERVDQLEKALLRETLSHTYTGEGIDKWLAATEHLDFETRLATAQSLKGMVAT